MRKLNARQLAFVAEYNKDKNATKAAQRAGYSEKTAYSQGHDLLKHPEIRRAIMLSQEKSELLSTVDRAWVLSKLRENVELAMALKPVLDKNGKSLGRLTYQGSVALKAIELLGKDLGMFKDQLDVSLKGEAELEKGFSLVHAAYVAQQKRDKAEREQDLN